MKHMDTKLFLNVKACMDFVTVVKSKVTMGLAPTDDHSSTVDILIKFCVYQRTKCPISYHDPTKH